jgi:hypothetical protein
MNKKPAQEAGFLLFALDQRQIMTILILYLQTN